MIRAAGARAVAFFGLWLLLEGTVRPGALALGALAAVAATWVSLNLAPPDGTHLRWGGLLRLLPWFLWKSVVAGVDVALRALGPRVRLNPGFVTYRGAPPRGDARNRYSMFTSLMPGTLPVAEDADGLLYHCLDVDQPVLESLAEDQRVLERCRGGIAHNAHG